MKCRSGRALRVPLIEQVSHVQPDGRSIVRSLRDRRRAAAAAAARALAPSSRAHVTGLRSFRKAIEKGIAYGSLDRRAHPSSPSRAYKQAFGLGTPLTGPLRSAHGPIPINGSGRFGPCSTTTTTTRRQRRPHARARQASRRTNRSRLNRPPGGSPSGSLHRVSLSHIERAYR